MSATVCDLREVRSRDIENLLQAEEREWLQVLRWDFRKSADLVRKFVDMVSLSGAVLINSAGPIGYSYFVFEDGKGLMGDLYVLPQYRTSHHEEMLMISIMEQIGQMGGTPRVEGQIMMLGAPLQKPLRYWNRFEVFERGFLITPTSGFRKLESKKLPDALAIEPWNSQHQEAAAHLIPESYRGHVDSRINDQYQSVTGARKFLENMLQFPGCGVFHGSASLAVFDQRDGRMCAMALSSIVSNDTAHLTQLCVAPEYQGLGLGNELLNRSVALLARDGCHYVSLTVTAENQVARAMYEHAGFRPIRAFTAYVWRP